ncbi:MAG: YihY/virulence factor BrkB family protein [Akkermansiaceae bacterium]
MLVLVRVSATQFLTFSKRVLRDFFFENNGLLLASAVAYNAMLSIVPLTAVLVVVFSQFYERDLLLDAIETEVSLINPEATPVLVEAAESFLESRFLAGWIGVLVLLFFSSMAFRVLENAFSVIFKSKIPPIKRKFWVSALIPYLFIGLVAVGLIVITSITALIESASGQIYRIAGFGFEMGWLASSGLHIAGFVGVVLLFTTLYKVMPVTRISFRLALSGGFTAAILWEFLRTALIWYFSSLSIVNVVYGSMATTIILLLSMEAAALIVLLGAQVIAEIQRGMDTGLRWHEEKDVKSEG